MRHLYASYVPVYSIFSGYRDFASESKTSLRSFSVFDRLVVGTCRRLCVVGIAFVGTLEVSPEKGAFNSRETYLVFDLSTLL